MTSSASRRSSGMLADAATGTPTTTPARFCCLRPADGGDHGRAGRKSVVDQQNGSAAKVEWRMLSVQVPVETCSLRLRLLNDDGQPLGSETVRGAHVDPVTGRDRSDAVLALEGMADLLHRNDIERCAERPGDLGSDLDTAPREADDDDIAAALGSELRRQVPARPRRDRQTGDWRRSDPCSLEDRSDSGWAG